MKTVNRMFGNTVNLIGRPHQKTGRGMPWRIATLALCSALLLPGAAMAKKPVEDPVGCSIFPPAYIDTGYDFTLKIVRDPAYTGVWSQPMVDAAAVFTKTDGGKITVSISETTSSYGYGVTYVNTTLRAPNSCNGGTCVIDTTVDAVITAVVKEPINKGKRFRETVCTPTTARVNPAS